MSHHRIYLWNRDIPRSVFLLWLINTTPIGTNVFIVTVVWHLIILLDISLLVFPQVGIDMLQFSQMATPGCRSESCHSKSSSHYINTNQSYRLLHIANNVPISLNITYYQKITIIKFWMTTRVNRIVYLEHRGN